LLERCGLVDEDVEDTSLRWAHSEQGVRRVGVVTALDEQQLGFT
jgi:hypothetical protein